MISRNTIIAYLKGMTRSYIADVTKLNVTTISRFLDNDSHDFKASTQKLLSDFCVEDFKQKQELMAILKSEKRGDL